MPIKFKELTHVYNPKTSYQHKALDNINLEFCEGKITAVIGETGSGKSTLVQHLNALLLPTSGSLEILDYNIEAKVNNKYLKFLRQDVGLVFQFSEYQLFEETIIKDVAFGPLNFGYSIGEAYARAKAALKLVGIDESMYENSPLELSGGQKRRVAIAGILAIDPKVIVLDEPTAGLDPKGAKDIISLFASLNKTAGKTIIIVTHDNEMVYSACDNTVLISKGKVCYSGKTLEFFNDEKLLDEYHILKPQIVELKNKLIKNGFKINEKSRTIEEITKDIKRSIKR